MAIQTTKPPLPKGFYTGGALMGGASGYAGAKLGQAAKGGLGNMFTGGMSPVDKLTGAPKIGLTPRFAPNVVSNAAPNVVPTQGFNLGKVGDLFGKEGLIEQNKTLLTGIGKGVMGVREGAIAEEQARLAMEENARQFNEAQALRARQQSNLDQESMMTKQQFDELNANRAKLRALLTGGM